MSKNSKAVPCVDDKWQAECDVRTLSEAAQIKKVPARLKRAQELAKKQLLDLASVASAGKEAGAGA